MDRQKIISDALSLLHMQLTMRELAVEKDWPTMPRVSVAEPAYSAAEVEQVFKQFTEGDNSTAPPQNAEPLWLVVEGRFDKGFKLYGPFNTLEDAENFGWGHCGQHAWWYERLTPPAGPIASDAISDEPPWLVVSGRFDTGFKFYGPFAAIADAELFGWDSVGEHEWWFEQAVPPESAVFVARAPTPTPTTEESNQ